MMVAIMKFTESLQQYVVPFILTVVNSCWLDLKSTVIAKIKTNNMGVYVL